MSIEPETVLNNTTKAQEKEIGGRVCIIQCNMVHLALQRELYAQRLQKLTLTVLVATIDAQWEGMGDVGSARYEPALLPPCPTTLRVLSYSN